MQLRASKLPPSPSAAAHSSPYPGHFFPCLSVFTTIAVDSIIFLPLDHCTQAARRRPRRTEIHSYCHRGRLKRDLKETSMLSWRRENLTPILIIYFCSPPNQSPYRRFQIDRPVCIEDQSSTRFHDSCHLRLQCSRPSDHHRPVC